MLGLGKSIHRLTAENDSSTNITINVGDADSVMSDAATAAADIAEIETQDSLGELEAEQVDIAATAAESMFSRIRTMQRNATGVNHTTGGEMVANLQLLGRLFGYETPHLSTLPSAESDNWSTPSRLPVNLQMAAEFAGELVRKGWEWVKKKWAEWVAKVKDLWNRYGSSASRYKRAATALKEKINGGDYSKLSDKNLSDGGLAKKLDSGIDNKIDPVRLVKSMLGLHTQVSAIKDAYIASMADSNLEAAIAFLEAEKDADDNTDGKDAVKAKTKPGPDGKPIIVQPKQDAVDPSSVQALNVFGKWIDTMTDHLSAFIESYDEAKIKALGRSDSDATNYTWKMSKADSVLPGNRAFVVRQRKPNDAATTGADTLELTTLRCSQYNTKAGRTDSINDQIPVLNQAQMTDLALAIEKASDELVTLAQTVDKGKPKRDRLTKAIARASDMAAKAESKEAKAHTAARKMATIMMQQIDNPANDFQTAALAACSNCLAYINQSLNAYGK
jgi:hypothetical protein